MKDVYEKIIVTLWSVLAVSIILLSSILSRINSADTDIQTSQACITDDADDFEGEFLEPQIPTISSPKPKSQQHIVSYQGRSFSYSAKFADRNDKHLLAAEKIGLHPGPENRAAAAKMRHQLREIKTNKNYVVEELTHSLPYLVPTAAARLDSIGKEFADILSRNGLPKYRFRVTSVLRSQEDIRRLKRCNANSVSNSPHNFGTSFDIGYAHFDKVDTSNEVMTDENLKLVLAQTLLNQQRAGNIYVKYEHKQGCFHITTRR